MIRDQLAPNDRTIARIILEAPALPGVPQFLGELMGDGPDTATLALSTLREVMMTRPLDRSAALEVVGQRACIFALFDCCSPFHPLLGFIL